MRRGVGLELAPPNARHPLVEVRRPLADGTTAVDPGDHAGQVLVLAGGGTASLLGRIGGPADPDFVDWLALDRVEGREVLPGRSLDEAAAELGLNPDELFT